MYFIRLLLIWFVIITGVNSDELQDFIGDDKELAVLNLNMDDVFNYFEPEMLMAQVDPDEYAEYDNMTPEEINDELVRLRDALERVYNTLLAFAHVLASLTADDFVELSQKLKDDPILFDKLLKDHSLNSDISYQMTLDGEEEDKREDDVADELVAYLNAEGRWANLRAGSSDADQEDEYEASGFFDILDDNPHQDFGDLRVYDEHGELDTSVEYWDPTEEYQMLVEVLGVELEDMNVLQKMGILTIIKKILKKIRRIIKKIKKKIVMVLKIIKLKVLIKKIRVVICLEIMYLIEKIKRTIKLILQLIKKIIEFLITELPFEILWEIKVVIRLILRILSDIIWELEIILLEVIVKTVKFLKKLEKIPVEIVYYFKMTLLEQLKLLKSQVGKDDENTEAMVYYNKVWSAYDDVEESADDDKEDNASIVAGLDAASFGSIWDYDGTPDIGYAPSDSVKVPKEIEEIFGEVFTKEEMDEYLRGDDYFSFDFVWPVDLKGVVLASDSTDNQSNTGETGNFDKAATDSEVNLSDELTEEAKVESVSDVSLQKRIDVAFFDNEELQETYKKHEGMVQNSKEGSEYNEDVECASGSWIDFGEDAIARKNAVTDLVDDTFDTSPNESHYTANLGSVKGLDYNIITVAASIILIYVTFHVMN